jgi:hypothetical protein
MANEEKILTALKRYYIGKTVGHTYRHRSYFENEPNNEITFVYRIVDVDYSEDGGNDIFRFDTEIVGYNTECTYPNNQKFEGEVERNFKINPRSFTVAILKMLKGGEAIEYYHNNPPQNLQEAADPKLGALRKVLVKTWVAEEGNKLTITDVTSEDGTYIVHYNAPSAKPFPMDVLHLSQKLVKLVERYVGANFKYRVNPDTLINEAVMGDTPEKKAAFIIKRYNNKEFGDEDSRIYIYNMELEYIKIPGKEGIHPIIR